MSFLEFTKDDKLPAELAGKQVVAQHSKPNYLPALAWALGGLLVAGVLLYIAAPKQVSQPRQLPLTVASQTETPQVIAKNVEDIQAGDVVVSYDEATGEQVFNRVVETYERTSYHLRFIETRSLETDEVQTFETTDEHPFWQVDIGWHEAGKLKPGDQLLQSNGQFAEVMSTRYEAHPEGVTVYNFQVADSHSYYVSAPTTRGPPVLVHNANYVVKPGQVASAYPEGRVVGGRGHSIRPTDPPAGARESGAWELTQENQRLMEAGRPPIGQDGLPVEIHHRNQSPHGPLDEMTSTTHDGVAHPESPSQINRSQFAGERARYWRSRIRVLLGQE